MSDIEFDPPGDLLLMRVVRRLVGQENRRISKKDILRDMEFHSGLSLFHFPKKPKLEAIRTVRVPANKLRGLAISEAERLKSFNLHFMIRQPDDGHISLRCSECNLAVDGSLCKREDGQPCGFDLENADPLISIELIKRFRIDPEFPVGDYPQS